MHTIYNPNIISLLGIYIIANKLGITHQYLVLFECEMVNALELAIMITSFFRIAFLGTGLEPVQALAHRRNRTCADATITARSALTS